MEPTTTSDYYFVTFGRKSGGLFDLLNLSPDATPEEVAEGNRKYQQELEKGFKENRRALREKLGTAESQKSAAPSAEITAEEFEKKVKQLEDEKTQKLTDFNKLKADYEAAQAQKRGLGSRGRWMNIPNWINLSERFSPARPGDSVFLAPQRALDKYDLERLINLLVEEFPSASEMAVSRQVKLAYFADQAWKLIKNDRIAWHSHIKVWIQEAQKKEPPWNLSAQSPLAFKPEFPDLCQSSDRSISVLSSEALEDFSALPKRGAESGGRIRLEDFLDELLKKAMKEKPAQPKAAKPAAKGQPGAAAKPSASEAKDEDMEGFLAFLELLGKMNEEEKDSKKKK